MAAQGFARLARGTLFIVLVACSGARHDGPPPPPATVPAPDPFVPPPVPTVVGGACPAPNTPANPIEYGQCVLTQSMTRAHASANVSVLLASDPAASAVDVLPSPESYSIVTQGERTLVVGRDGVGAMYGAMDLAERLDQHGAAAFPLASPVKTSPLMKVRAANLFLVLPEPGKAWWYRDPEFWVEYLDMMARGRFNLLDMHGMYNMENTFFPNVLLYLATSASMPAIGIPRAEREANLAMLNVIIKMASVRGIKVALMNYQVSLSIPGDEKETAEEKELVPQYTREALADLATRAPELSYLGFRVGETGRPPEWYVSTFVDTLKAVHAKAVAYTRTWLTKKPALLSVIQASGPETLVEAKFNGEQLGPPYVISGGGMDRWSSYSYENFLEDPAPYKFVFQVRAGGTHRIFRYASYARTRRTILSMTLSPRVQGFTFEAAHAYFPQGDFYHAHPEDSFSPYAFRRDELSYLLFGRLGYDPNTPEAVFRKMLEERVGTDGLWDAVQAASDITPWMLAGQTCGPDQRDDAPELDIIGPVSYWATPNRSKDEVGGFRPTSKICSTGHQPFDAFAVAGPYEAAEDLLERRGTSRLSPIDLSLTLLSDGKTARAAALVAIDPQNREARDVVRECTALADLGDWFAHRLRAATALAVYEGTGSDAWLHAAKGESKVSISAYRDLVRDTGYITPFDDTTRMSRTHLTRFHWSKQLPFVERDLEAIDEVVTTRTKAHPTSKAKGPLPAPNAWLTTPRRPGPELVDLKVSPEDPHAAAWKVTVTLGAPPPQGARVRVLHRRFSSNGGDWTSTDAAGSGTVWTTSIDGTGDGAMFAVEINGVPGEAWRYPDVTKETPYRPLAP